MNKEYFNYLNRIPEDLNKEFNVEEKKEQGSLLGRYVKYFPKDFEKSIYFEKAKLSGDLEKIINKSNVKPKISFHSENEENKTSIAALNVIGQQPAEDEIDELIEDELSNDIRQNFKTSTPKKDVDLRDVETFLRYILKKEISGSPEDMSQDREIYENIKNYFESKNKLKDFDSLILDIIKDILFKMPMNINDPITDTFKELLLIDIRNKMDDQMIGKAQGKISEEEISFIKIKGNEDDIQKLNQMMGHEISDKVNLIIDNFTDSSIPKSPITLYDSREFLKYIITKEYLDESKEGLNELKKVYENLKTYYATTHLKDEFEDIRMSIIKNMVYHELDGVDEARAKPLKDIVYRNLRPKVSYPNISISARKPDLISLEDLNFLREVGTQVDNRNIEFLMDEIKENISEKYSKLLSDLNGVNLSSSDQNLSSKNLFLVIEGKKALLGLLTDPYIGGRVDLKSLSEDPRFPELKKLFQCQEVRGERTDQFTLLSLMKEHKEAKLHPKVGIEGGGPTGLLLALTQFRAGADVCVFEKRSTVFDRTQVVRLDPKWVAMLQFYLGEKFNKLFVDKNHQGVFRPDGFVEIVTRDLEDALNQRVSEMVSVASGEFKKSPIELMAAHEVSKVNPPKEEGGSFTITAKYDAEQAKEWGRSKKEASVETREVDILICAGGKTSSTLKKFLPSSTPVNNPEYYGVCSWATSNVMPFRGQKEDLTYFQDFRGMVQINEEFLDNFKNDAIEKISESLDCTPEEAMQYFGEMNPAEWTDRPFLQTRTFENRGLLYVGMELPAALDKKIKEIESQKIDEKKKKQILKDIRTAWYDQIGKKYNVGEELIMDSKFLSTFPVEQNRLAEKNFVTEVKGKGKNLLITAAGDAFASPHFMRYSGLTGARENVLHLQEYMKEFAKAPGTPEEQEQLLRRLNNLSEETARFVIKRGGAFLKSKKKEEIEQQRYDQMLKALSTAEMVWDQPKITKEPNGDGFILEQDASHLFNIKPTKDGRYEVVRMAGSNEDSVGIVEVFYVNSLDQLLLQENMEVKEKPKAPPVGEKTQKETPTKESLEIRNFQQNQVKEKSLKLLTETLNHFGKIYSTKVHPTDTLIVEEFVEALKNKYENKDIVQVLNFFEGLQEYTKKDKNSEKSLTEAVNYFTAISYDNIELLNNSIKIILKEKDPIKALMLVEKEIISPFFEDQDVMFFSNYINEKEKSEK